MPGFKWTAFWTSCIAAAFVAIKYFQLDFSPVLAVPYYPLFVVGGAWFWLLMVSSFILLIYLCDFEGWAWSLLTVLGVSALLTTLGDLNVFQWVWEHKLLTLSALGVRLLYGLIYGTCEIFLLARKERQKYDEDKMAFLRDKNVIGNSVPSELVPEWSWLRGVRKSGYTPTFAAYKKEFLNGQRRPSGGINVPPLPYSPTELATLWDEHVLELVAAAKFNNRTIVSDHKHRIFTWVLWPEPCFVWMLLDDFVKRLKDWIWAFFSQVWQQIADRQWAGTANDFVITPSKPLDPNEISLDK